MTDVRGARIVRLIEDPAVTGDLLLIGFALAAQRDFGWKDETRRVASLLWPESEGFRLDIAMKNDIRTYKPVLPVARRCTHPLARKVGTCKRNAISSKFLTDWATGEKAYAGGCSKHLAWFKEAMDINLEAKPDGPPLPHANRGGALRVHFPRLDWRTFWRNLDPGWVEHPERESWPKPDLSLVLGDGEGGLAAVPMLSVVPIGGASS